ncbi:MAG: DNA-directed RNA polymerase subunit L [Sulfolobales archaeon]|nr:DNA-directed RNA polymerase subunit L [Sulfolobales archaeon]MCX8186229.1 DNA-directed RNA polymerase subunit L [Sulfolobales archaeon]
MVGEDHTLGNLISKYALNHPNVKIAAYSIDHPLTESPKVVIVTDGSKNPLEVLKEVIKEVNDTAEKLLKLSEDLRSK